MSSNHIWYKIKAIRTDDDYTVYLTNKYVGDSHYTFNWGWARYYAGEPFWSEKQAKSRLRANAIRDLRSRKFDDGTPWWKVQIVRCDETDDENIIEAVVWPKKDILLLDRLAAI